MKKKCKGVSKATPGPRGGGFQSIKIALKYDLNYDACKVQSGTPTIGVKHCTKVQSGTPNFSVKHLVYFGNKI